MKAVVLVGGEGTRLRPLTETTPKPLLPLIDRPFLHQVLDHLAAHGVHEVVLSSSYLEESFRPFIEDRHGDPGIVWITESQPLGTAGAIVNALEHIDGTFLVLNGDVLTDLDLTAMMALHRDRGAVATIALTRVEDARPFGLVDTEPDGRVVAFREKPAEPIPGDINAGTYVLDPEALAGWERGREISIEREVYPSLIASGAPVFAFGSDAYWRDLGTPENYLQAQFDVLEGRLLGERFPAPFVAGSADVHERARIGRLVVLGEGTVVGPDATVDRSILHGGAKIGPGATVVGSILGAGAVVGAEAVVEGCVLGAGARVEAGARVRSERIGAGG